jgi:hypothetical protein
MDMLRLLLHWLNSPAVINLDVEISDHAKYTIAIDDSIKTVIAISDYAKTSVAISDRIQGL